MLTANLGEVKQNTNDSQSHRAHRLRQQQAPNHSRGTFPILSRDPSFPETKGKRLGLQKNDG